MSARPVVVTGASSSIGEACVETLVAAGFQCYGSVRREADASRLAERFGAGFSPLTMDVTDAVGVQNAAQHLQAALAGRALAGLVNNAGVALPGPLLHQPLEEVRRQMEVNLIGQLQVVQAFAPLLGAAPRAVGAKGPSS